MDSLPIDLYGLILDHMDPTSGLAFAISSLRVKRGFLRYIRFGRSRHNYIEASSNVTELQLCLEAGYSQECIYNALVVACKKDRTDMAACIINSRKLDISLLNLAFVCAYEHGRAEIVRMLIQAGVDPSMDNNLAIEIVCEYGHIEIVKTLLDDPRVDPSIMKSSPLMGAVREGYSETVRLLLNHPKITSISDMLSAKREAKRQNHQLIISYIQKWLKKHGR